MKQVYLLVEGPTEVTFVDKVLTPHLSGLALTPIRVTTRAGGAQPKKGGSVTYASFKKQIQMLLRNPTASMVTTMLDYQGLHKEFPGREGRTENSARAKGEAVASAMQADISDARYTPFVIMHEFEALLFSVPEVIAEVLRRPELVQPLKAIRASKSDYVATPEEINDSAATSPSARIEALCLQKFGSKNVFQKTAHGPLIAEKIGLTTIRDHCPHFDNWLQKLEALAASS
ncbi:DUF4276 family protein [Haloferula sargassicola]|uniref:DUF4276 family protein n=1 Tax=Haloferula sargassicola TaxID=490096 RepID=A0ABP9UTQ4_9BACT